MYFCYFVIIFPWKGERGTLFELTWISFTQGCWVPIMVENGPVVLEVFFLILISSMYVKLFVIISLWERMGPFMNKVEFHIPSPKNALWQVWLKFVLEKILNFINGFLLFRYSLLLEKNGSLRLNKREFTSPKDAMCQVWLKLTSWFWRRQIKDQCLKCNIMLLFNELCCLNYFCPYIHMV